MREPLSEGVDVRARLSGDGGRESDLRDMTASHSNSQPRWGLHSRWRYCWRACCCFRTLKNAQGKRWEV